MEANSTNPNHLIVAEIQLVYKTKLRATDRPKVTSSQQAYNLLISSWDGDRIELLEQFKVLLLNNAGKVLGIFEVATGGTDFVPVDAKLIFVAALKANASRILLSHNHPSGNLRPSQADIALTKRLTQGGELLGIKILDHLIVSPDGYYSFNDEGLI